MKNDRIKKGDVILVVFLLITAGILLWVESVQSTGDYAVVDIGGKREKYSLSENQKIVIENKDTNGKNIISIKDGTVSMTYANCPDLICVHHRPIEKNGETIICVPNDLSVSIVSSVQSDIDN